MTNSRAEKMGLLEMKKQEAIALSVEIHGLREQINRATDGHQPISDLPLEELTRYAVPPEEILRFEYSPRFRDAAAAVAQRARRYYQLARESLPAEDRRSMAPAELMGSVYWRLLRKLERRQFNVFAPTPARVSKLQKLLLIFRTWYRMTSGAVVPNYGVP